MIDLKPKSSTLDRLRALIEAKTRSEGWNYFLPTKSQPNVHRVWIDSKGEMKHLQNFDVDGRIKDRTNPQDIKSFQSAISGGFRVRVSRKRWLSWCEKHHAAAFKAIMREIELTEEPTPP